MKPIWRSAVVTILAGMSFAALGSQPATASCPIDPAIGAADPQLSTLSASTRLSFISERLDVGRRRALIWSIGFGVAYGAAAVTQLAVAPTLSEDRRVVFYVGGASAVAGTITRIVNVPWVIGERRRLRRFLRSHPHECVALREAERALARSARWEQRSTRLALHVAALAYSVGAGLVLALAFNRPMQGFRQLAIGGAVGQAMIVSTPQVTLNALGAYRRAEVRPMPSVHTVPMVLPGGGGIAIAGSM